MTISIVGVDLSKSVFQLSMADAGHRVVNRKRLSRAQVLRFQVYGSCVYRTRSQCIQHIVMNGSANQAIFPKVVTFCVSSQSGTMNPKITLCSFF